MDERLFIEEIATFGPAIADLLRDHDARAAANMVRSWAYDAQDIVKKTKAAREM